MGTKAAAHNVTVLGSGKTTVVLGHGASCDRSVWKHLVPHLVGDYKVILYDDIGAANTNPDHYDFQRYSTIDGYVEDLIAILEELKVEGCIFVGHSLSPLVAAIASISHPKLFRKVIMISATPRLMNAEDYHGGIEPEMVEQMKTALEEDPLSFHANAAPRMLAASPESAVVREYLEILSKERPEIVLNRSRMVLALDLRPYLGRVTLPCHIIQGSNDMLVPVEVAQYIHRSLGGKSVVEVIPVEGHVPQLSSPEVTNPVVLRHIREDIIDKK